MIMGEDVGRAGGVFRATAGLLDRFGPNRCVDTPLAKPGSWARPSGSAWPAGARCASCNATRSYPALDQLITHVRRYRWQTGGGMSFPLVVRMPYGGGVRAPELHDDSPETYYVHTPGVRRSRFRRRRRTRRPARRGDPQRRPGGRARAEAAARAARGGSVRRARRRAGQGAGRARGTVSLIAYGSMVPLCEQAAETLADECSCEVLDLRSLKPLDEDALLASVAKTGRAVIVQEAPRTAWRSSAPSSPRSSRRRRCSTSAGRCSA